MEENNLLDSEIWVENRIEESKQEIKDDINEKIRALNYEKTIEKLQNELNKLYKEIVQVDYDKKRAIELLEEDIALKFDDINVMKDSAIEQKIIDMTESDINNLKNKIDNIDNDSRSFKEQITSDQNDKFESLKLNIEKKMDEIKSSGEKSLQDKMAAYKQETDAQIIEQKEHINNIIENFNKEFRYAIDKKNNSEGNLEEFLEEKLGLLKNELNNKIEKQKDELAQKMLSDIENFEKEKLKENYELIQKSIKEIESINQNILEKIKKEQDKYITKKIKESDSQEEINKISSDIEFISMQLQDIPLLIEKVKDENLKEMQQYVESRILRMKYAISIQSITEEINKLNMRIKKLENNNTDDDSNDNEDNVNTLKDILKLYDIPEKKENTLYSAAKQIANITKKKCQILDIDSQNSDEN